MTRRGQTDFTGLWTASVTALLALVSLGLAMTTRPRSGPFCSVDCVHYPYTDNLADFVSRDYWWMYPASALLAAVVALFSLLYDRSPPQQRWPATTGLCLAVVAVVPLAITYGIQLTVLQPNLLQGRTDGLSPWSQYHPSGIFIGLENIGYTVLALAFLFVGVAQSAGTTALQRSAGRILVLGGVTIVLMLVLLATAYRSELSYRFEVGAIFVSWLVIAASAVLLALHSLRSVGISTTIHS